MNTNTLILLLAVGVAAACSSDGDGPSGLDPDEYELTVVSGGGQSGLAGTVADEPLVAHRRRVAVRPLPFQPADFEVVSGLAEGDEIAVTGIRQLRDGDRVHRNGAGPE